MSAVQPAYRPRATGYEPTDRTGSVGSLLLWAGHRASTACPGDPILRFAEKRGDNSKKCGDRDQCAALVHHRGGLDSGAVAAVWVAATRAGPGTTLGAHPVASNSAHTHGPGRTGMRASVDCFALDGMRASDTGESSRRRYPAAQRALLHQHEHPGDGTSICTSSSTPRPPHSKACIPSGTGPWAPCTVNRTAPAT